MLKGIDTRQRVEFTSKEDTTEPKTVFVMKPLSGAEMLGLTGNIDLIKMLELSIVEVRNFEDSSLDVKGVLSCLPTSVLSELIEEFNNINSLTENDEKN